VVDAAQQLESDARDPPHRPERTGRGVEHIGARLTEAERQSRRRVLSLQRLGDTDEKGGLVGIGHGDSVLGRTTGGRNQRSRLAWAFLIAWLTRPTSRGSVICSRLLLGCDAMPCRAVRPIG